MLLQETYVKDLYFYDKATAENLSKYTLYGYQNVSYDSTTESYYMQRTTSINWQLCSMTLKDVVFPNRVEISADILQIDGYNTQTGLGLSYNGNSAIGKRTYSTQARVYSLAIINISPTGSEQGVTEQNVPASSIPLNTWLHHKITIDGSDITEKVYDGDALISTVTKTLNVLSNDNNQLQIWNGMYRTATAKIKNIQVKLL
jgi:hypothetical protein